MSQRDDFISLFSSKQAKLLVLLAITGIMLSVYPVYEGLYGDTEKKIGLIKKWQELGENYQALKPETVNAVYNQLSQEIGSKKGRLETTISILSTQSPEQSACTYILKFLTGGMLYFFVYGMMLIFILINNRTGSRKQLFKRSFFVIPIWVGLCLANTFIPFFSVSVNYIFLPSCLTLVAAVMSILWSEANPEYKPNPVKTRSVIKKSEDANIKS